VWPWAKTPEQRLKIYAKTLGILTEYWRTNRKAAAVMHFCGLGYSRPERPRGQTSDHFTDIRNLTYQPDFYNHVRQAFSPVGLMIEFWNNPSERGEKITVPVHIINDTYEDYEGTLKFTVSLNDNIVSEQSVPVKVNATGKILVNVNAEIPGRQGECKMTAEIQYYGESVKSIREFEVK